MLFKGKYTFINEMPCHHICIYISRFFIMRCDYIMNCMRMIVGAEDAQVSLGKTLVCLNKS